MQEPQPNAFIEEKRVKFQVEFPGNEIQFPGSQNPLDRIFYTFAGKRAKVMCEAGDHVFRAFPFQTVLNIHNTSPVSTVTVERGFSCMNNEFNYYLS